MSDPSFPRLGLKDVNSGAGFGQWIANPGGGEVTSFNPADGQSLARVTMATRSDYEQIVARAQEAFSSWRMLPAPQRGEIVRQLGNALREAKDDLGRLVTLEAGKIRSEGLGEVQEMIDICDFAVGLSRQLRSEERRVGKECRSRWSAN